MSDRSLMAEPFLEVLSRGGRGRVAERSGGESPAHLPPGRDVEGEAMLAAHGGPGAAQFGESLDLRPGDVRKTAGGHGERRVGEAGGDDLGKNGLHLGSAGRADSEARRRGEGSVE